VANTRRLLTPTVVLVGSFTPVLRTIAAIRFFSTVRRLTSAARSRSSSRVSRTARGGMYAVGIKSARSNCASTVESSLSVLIWASAMARTFCACARVTPATPSSPTKSSYSVPQVRDASRTT